MTRMRQPADTMRDQNGTKQGHSILAGRQEGGIAVLTRLPGAIARALLVVVLVVLPSAMLSTTSPDTVMIVTLIAICAAFFTLVEYTTECPSIIEFRSAPPFNRLRFVTLLVTVLALSFCMGDQTATSSFGKVFLIAGERLGASMDFPFSPVRLLVLMMPQNTDPAVLDNIRVAGGLSYIISLLSLSIFIILLRMKRWPKRYGTFNVWVNLPRFDPTAGGDVVARLNKDSSVNLMLGFLLPFLIPAVIKVVVLFGGSINLSDPQTLIWTVTAWAFLPASLLMRGVALSRVAQLIYKERKRAYLRAVEDGLLPA